MGGWFPPRARTPRRHASQNNLTVFKDGVVIFRSNAKAGGPSGNLELHKGSPPAVQRPEQRQQEGQGGHQQQRRDDGLSAALEQLAAALEGFVAAPLQRPTNGSELEDPSASTTAGTTTPTTNATEVLGTLVRLAARALRQEGECDSRQEKPPNATSVL
jgi:hypothetical protein